MDIRHILFKYRGSTPIPFLIVMVLGASPTVPSFCAGFVLALAGEALRFWGVSIAGSETRTTGAVGGSRLVVAGPFAYVRNPLYVGNILLYCGIGIMSNAYMPWLLFLAFAYFVFQYSMIVSSEEEYLTRTFGAQYEEYRKNVPRFIPRPIPWHSGMQVGQEAEFARALRSERRTLQAFGIITVLLIVLGVVRGGS